MKIIEKIWEKSVSGYIYSAQNIVNKGQWYGS